LISDDWKNAQKSVADFLRKHKFGIKEEKRLKSGKRIDVLAQKKIGNSVLHIIVEVKDWNNVSRKQETNFVQQITKYLIEFALEEILPKGFQEKWEKSDKVIRDKFIGILCLTKGAHFSFRQVSHHFFKKNKEVQGIPLREQIVDNIKLYVARFDYISKVFEDANIPLYREPEISDWF
jgi:hypothetical protein